jgi:hypothetical protein
MLNLVVRKETARLLKVNVGCGIYSTITRNISSHDNVIDLLVAREAVGY